MTIVVVSDTKYLPHLQVLIASLVKNYSQALIHVHLVNVSYRNVLKIQNIAPQIQISRGNVSIADPKKFAAYCANIRARVIFSILERGDGLVLYLDADSIVRRSISSLFRLVENNDILILQQKKVKPVLGEHLVFAAGVILFKNSQKTRIFVEAWKSALEPHLNEWFADQIYFARTASSSVARIGDLPFSFIDWSFKPLSHIWVGKGSKKYENKLYALEELRYKNNKIIGFYIMLQQAPLFFSGMCWRIKTQLIKMLLILRNLLHSKK